MKKSWMLLAVVALFANEPAYAKAKKMVAPNLSHRPASPTPLDTQIPGAAQSEAASRRDIAADGFDPSQGIILPRTPRPGPPIPINPGPVGGQTNLGNEP